jgi:hypothetical protein
MIQSLGRLMLCVTRRRPCYDLFIVYLAQEDISGNWRITMWYRLPIGMLYIPEPCDAFLISTLQGKAPSADHKCLIIAVTVKWFLKNWCLHVFAKWFCGVHLGFLIILKTNSSWRITTWSCPPNNTVLSSKLYEDILHIS